jgi:hypothetical protein
MLKAMQQASPQALLEAMPAKQSRQDKTRQLRQDSHPLSIHVSLGNEADSGRKTINSAGTI